MLWSSQHGLGLNVGMKDASKMVIDRQDTSNEHCRFGSDLFLTLTLGCEAAATHVSRMQMLQANSFIVSPSFCTFRTNG